MNDWQLLHHYATQRSEESFRALVERYSGVVYHTALRQTRDPVTAQEVAQNVFIDLARKAGKIPRRANLCGWLFCATRFAALREARLNSDRLRRQNEIIAMQPTTTADNEPDSVWDRLAPHLNDALDKLSDRDRDLILTRFFASKSHKDLADSFGLSEAAARKRLSRAMEKLRAIFEKQGLVITSLALSAAFAARGAQAAPSNLASTWASMATAKASAGAATSAVNAAHGWLSFITAPAPLIAVSGIVLLAGLAILHLRATPGGSTPNTSPAYLPSPLVAAQSAPAQAEAQSTPVAEPAPAPSKAPLDRITAALHDPTRATNYPNSVMQDAVDQLGAAKKAAVPILQAALDDADLRVRLRAIDGLGIVGPDAKSATSSLLKMLQTVPSDEPTVYSWRHGISQGILTSELILISLGELGPDPEILPSLRQMIRENEIARDTIRESASSFDSAYDSMWGGNWLWFVANQNPKLVNDAFSPLLLDSNSDVRRVAAMLLASSLGEQSAPCVFPVAVELLRSGDDRVLRVEGISLLKQACTEKGGAPIPVESLARRNSVSDPFLHLNAVRLGTNLNTVVSALADLARDTTRSDLRLSAASMLDTLSPDFRANNPHLTSALDQDNELKKFHLKLMSQSAQMTLTELSAGLKQFPKAAPEITEALERRGPEARNALPDLAVALNALAPAAEMSPMDRNTLLRARQETADAMQRIAPERPKPIFTMKDVFSFNSILLNRDQREDPDRSQRVSQARKDSEWPHRGPFDVTPNQVRRLLSAIKQADTSKYDALVAKIAEIDPHFSENPAE
jgi:RNA polymerase sigma factor (sigma-70 family)